MPLRCVNVRASAYFFTGMYVSARYQHLQSVLISHYYEQMETKEITCVRS